MKRKFLYEIVDTILEGDEFKGPLFTMLDSYKPLRELLKIIYNPKYEWELNKEIFSTTSRSQRENGGFPMAWADVVDVIKNKLVRNTQSSPRFPDFYAKACRSCNKRDVEILNYMLKNRNIPGFKGAKKKQIVEALSEYFGDSDGENS